MGANYKINQIKISWQGKISIPYSATHILNSPADTCVKKQKALCWTFYKTNIYSYNTLGFTTKQIKLSDFLKSVMYTKPWWVAFVFPAVISHHSKKNRWTVSPQTQPPLYGTVVLVTYVIISNRVTVFELLEIKESLAIFSATALNLKSSASLFDWQTAGRTEDLMTVSQV